MRLAIHTKNNEVTYLPTDKSSAGTQPWTSHFSRRWEALFLGLLLTSWRGGTGVSAPQLFAEAHRRGQRGELNRAQLQRLLHSLRAFLVSLPEGVWDISHPPRKQTVGPWQLHVSGLVAEDMHVEIDDALLEFESSYPALCEDQDTDALAAFLGRLLVADTMAVGGQYLEAIDVGEELLNQRMRPEATGMVLMRLCNWHRMRGGFDDARRCARSALALNPPNDQGIAPLARMALLRIDYDESPATSWESLWFYCSHPSLLEPDNPERANARADWRGLADWHNLRALLARRRMLALVEGITGSLGPSDQPVALHKAALMHFQAALYMAAWHRDWDRLQAVVANLAYHLQEGLSLAPVLEIAVSQVMSWHRLTMAYEDKLGAGRDTAWEYIFFGQFWLDHQQSLGPDDAKDPLAHTLENTGPDQEAFYIKAVQRLRECGGARQIVIGLTLYLRFVQEHMSGCRDQESAVQRLCQQIKELLHVQSNTLLLNNLHKEGYAKYWPSTLRLALDSEGADV